MEPSTTGWLLQGSLHVRTGQEVDSVLAGEQLRRPFVLDVAQDCSIQRLGFPTDLPDDALSVLHALITAWDVRFTPKAAGLGWAARHSDSRGRIVTLYRRAADPQAPMRAFTRRQLRYASVWPSVTPQYREPNIVKSTGSGALAADGFWLERVQDERRVEFGKTTSGEPTVAEITSSELRRGAGSALAIVELGPLRWLSISHAPPARQTDATDRVPDHIADAPLETLLSNLLSARSAGLGRPGSATLGALVAALRRHPEIVKGLLAWVRASSLPKDELSFVFFALAKAGTPEAQTALLSLMDDPAAQGPDSIRAAIALGALKDPDDRTVAAVAARAKTWEASMAQGEAAEMTTGSATLTLGTWADRQDEHNPELASMLRQGLADRLEETLSMEETCTLLRAVGNTGHDDLLATAIAYLEHEDSQVRVDAARALRRMDPDATAELLGEHLATETDPRARRELCMSFMDQASGAGVVPPAAVIEAALAQLLVEKDPSARPVLIELIVMGADAYPAARAALIALFATEKNAAILKLIGSVIPASELP